VKENAFVECEKCGWPLCSRECQNSIYHQNECEFTAARGEKVWLTILLGGKLFTHNFFIIGFHQAFSNATSNISMLVTPEMSLIARKEQGKVGKILPIAIID
jgi:hypothetical protein